MNFEDTKRSFWFRLVSKLLRVHLKNVIIPLLIFIYPRRALLPSTKGICHRVADLFSVSVACVAEAQVGIIGQPLVGSLLRVSRPSTSHSDTSSVLEFRTNIKY